MTFQEGTASAAHKAASTMQWGGGGSALFFGMTANEFAAIGGLLIGVVGLLVNIWFKAQHLAIAKKKHRPDPEE